VTSSLLSTTKTVDAVFFYIFGICIVMLLGITATMIFFVLKYNRKKCPEPTPSPSYNIWLEATWTIIPTLIVISIFYYGWQGYTTLRNVPKQAMVVKVLARQWSWAFTYPNGKTSDKLYVPVDKPVRLEITSADVIHSLYIPAFRIKRDAVPGMTTHEWFRAPATGSYDIFCAEYCGVGHSKMTSKVEAMPVSEFQSWYQQKEAPTAAARGKALLARYGCTGCHSLDGTKGVGPTLKGIFGRTVTVMTDGRERTLTVDEDYIKRSILEPKADVVTGFSPVMPSFKGRISDHDLEEIVEFLKEEGSEGTPVSKKSETAATGKELAAKNGCTGCHSVDGSSGVGPTWKGLFGKQVAVTTAGKERTVTADADYIKKSITDPKADVVKGFSPIMPAFSQLSEKDLDALVEYIRSLK
jgi:cytochrome c oxidase subunit 2